MWYLRSGASSLQIASYRVVLEPERPAEVSIGMRFYPRNRFGFAHVRRIRGKYMEADLIEGVPYGTEPVPSGMSFTTTAPTSVSRGPRLDRLLEASKKQYGLEDLPPTTKSVITAEEWYLREIARAVREN